MIVSSTDLFLAGLGTEIAGAWYLARGLIVSPAEIARRSRSHYDYSSPLVIAASKDRVDAEAGVGGLILGFGLQVAGYTLGLIGAAGSVEASVGTLLIGLLTLGAGIGVIVLWRRLLESHVMKHLVEVARYHVSRPGRAEKPSAHQLVMFGQELGHQLTEDEVTNPGEGHVRYAARVFGVEAEQVSSEVLHRSPLEMR